MNTTKNEFEKLPQSGRGRKPAGEVKIKKNINLEVSLEVSLAKASGEVKSADVINVRILGSSSDEQISVENSEKAQEKISNKYQKEKSRQLFINAIIMALFILGIIYAVYYTTFFSGN